MIRELMRPPEKQDLQVVGNQRNRLVLFLGSLPRPGGGWGANTALEPTADPRFGLPGSAGFATRQFGGGSAFVR